jgi:murein L,D-transpeptidase YcbB/YkuD
MRIKNKIRVHLAYFTAWPDEKGKMRYYTDIYGRDKLLRKALSKHDAAYTRIIRSASTR